MSLLNLEPDLLAHYKPPLPEPPEVDPNLPEDVRWILEIDRACAIMERTLKLEQDRRFVHMLRGRLVDLLAWRIEQIRHTAWDYIKGDE